MSARQWSVLINVGIALGLGALDRFALAEVFPMRPSIEAFERVHEQMLRPPPERGTGAPANPPTAAPRAPDLAADAGAAAASAVEAPSPRLTEAHESALSLFAPDILAAMAETYRAANAEEEFSRVLGDVETEVPGLVAFHGMPNAGDGRRGVFKRETGSSCLKRLSGLNRRLDREVPIQQLRFVSVLCNGRWIGCVGSTLGGLTLIDAQCIKLAAGMVGRKSDAISDAQRQACVAVLSEYRKSRWTLGRRMGALARDALATGDVRGGGGDQVAVVGRADGAILAIPADRLPELDRLRARLEELEYDFGRSLQQVGR